MRSNGTTRRRRLRIPSYLFTNFKEHPPKGSGAYKLALSASQHALTQSEISSAVDKTDRCAEQRSHSTRFRKAAGAAKA
jgi:hypothetical protein